MSLLKGKRILPRALRHLSPEQTLTLLTLMIATFDTLDTVVDAPLLDTALPASSTMEARKERARLEMKTEVFLASIVAPIMAVVGRIELRMVTGMLGLLMNRNNLMRVVRSRVSLSRWPFLLLSPFCDTDTSLALHVLIHLYCAHVARSRRFDHFPISRRVAEAN